MAHVINISAKAKEQIVLLLAKREKKSLGIRIGVKSSGCAGLRYSIEYADEVSKYDEVIKLENDVMIIIDAKALMYLIGTDMDYVETEFKSGFVFTNPNAKSQCGCGKSFGI